MIRPIVPNDTSTEPQRLQPIQDPGPQIDLLSEVLSLLKPRSYSSGGFSVNGEIAIRFPAHKGIKCYAVLAGKCWLVVEGVTEPVLINAGDCFLLPHGRPFHLTTDLQLEPILYTQAREQLGMNREVQVITEGVRYIAGGHFALSGAHAETLLHSLPPIVHIRSEADKATMRWSLERMREELRNPQPGASLITQQLAYMMLIQALRLHMAEAIQSQGWLAALADRHMSVAIANMHREPGRAWTLQSLAECVGMSRSVFALRFREVVGTTPMEYVARWRMLLAADRLRDSSDSVAAIAQSLGYESISAFGKAFRRIMGCSPRKYSRAASSPLSTRHLGGNL